MQRCARPDCSPVNLRKRPSWRRLAPKPPRRWRKRRTSGSRQAPSWKRQPRSGAFLPLWGRSGSVGGALDREQPPAGKAVDARPRTPQVLQNNRALAALRRTNFDAVRRPGAPYNLAFGHLQRNPTLTNGYTARRVGGSGGCRALPVGADQVLRPRRRQCKRFLLSRKNKAIRPQQVRARQGDAGIRASV